MLRYVAKHVSSMLLRHAAKKFSAVVIPAVFGAVQAKTPPNDAIEQAIMAYQNAEMGKGHISVGIIDNGKRYFFSSDPKLTPNAVYEIGSIGKTITALLVARAVNDKQLASETTLAQLLPSYQLPKTVTNLSLKQLLTHTSGLPRLPNNLAGGPHDPYGKYEMTDLRAYLSGAELADTGKVNYSNLGYGLLGHVLATSQKQSYQNLLKQFAKTLDMSQTGVDNKKSQLQGFEVSGEATSPWHFTEAMVGAGGIHASVNDLLNYLGLMLSVKAAPAKGELGNWQKAAKTVLNDLVKQDELAWAWMKNFDGKHHVYWHNGGTGGFASFMAFDLKRQRGVVVLANQAVNVDELGITFMDDKPKHAAMELAKSLQGVNPKINPETASRISGQYVFGPGVTMDVFERNGLLYTQMIKQPPFRLRGSDKPLTLVVTEVGAELQFYEGDSGNIEKVVLRQNGHESPAYKTK